MASVNGRKTIFITGAASGIGAETARLFVKRGWFCGLYDVNHVGLKAVAAEIGTDNCHIAKLDVRDRADWSRAIASFSEVTGGKMHVLFNNAGIGRHGWFEQIPPEDSDLLIDVNVKGVINGAYAALPLLKATQGARIVNTASVAGVVGPPQLAVYAASKWAVRGFTEALDAELSSLGIRVTSLMPWFVDTPILEMGNKEGANEKMSDQMEANGVKVYPVSMAAERAWDAAHGKEMHYMVGKDAERARRFMQWMPELVRKNIRKNAPARD